LRLRLSIGLVLVIGSVSVTTEDAWSLTQPINDTYPQTIADQLKQSDL